MNYTRIIFLFGFVFAVQIGFVDGKERPYIGYMYLQVHIYVYVQMRNTNLSHTMDHWREEQTFLTCPWT